MRWFKNIKRKPFDVCQISLDYSLQLRDGIESFRGTNSAAWMTAATARLSLAAPLEQVGDRPGHTGQPQPP
jgi:hypothetical protein